MGRPFSLELKMRVVALKDLTYSPDGLKIEAVAAGVEFDCPESIAEDYGRAGLINRVVVMGYEIQASGSGGGVVVKVVDKDTGQVLGQKAFDPDGGGVKPEETDQGGNGNPDGGNDNHDGQNGKPDGGNDNPPAPDPVAAVKTAEADAAPRHPKAARKPKAE